MLRADAVGDGGGDLGALGLGHAGAVEPALAEGRDPGGDAMLDRRRPLDQPGIDLGEAGGLVDRGEFLGRRDTSCSPRPAADSRG